jgi:hypothetical protein
MNIRHDGWLDTKHDGYILDMMDTYKIWWIHTRYDGYYIYDGY